MLPVEERLDKANAQVGLMAHLRSSGKHPLLNLFRELETIKYRDPIYFGARARAVLLRRGQTLYCFLLFKVNDHIAAPLLFHSHKRQYCYICCATNLDRGMYPYVLLTIVDS